MGFTYDEAARLSGMSLDQLRRILTTGLHDPEHESSILSFRDLVSLRTIVRLKNYGVSHKKLRAAYVRLLEYADSPWSQLQVGVGPKKKVSLLHPVTHQWEEVAPGQQLLASFSIKEVEEEMAEAVARARQRKPEDAGKFEKTRGVMGAEECFRGTRIPKTVVLDYLNDGASSDEILAEYPSLTIDDINAAKLAS